MLEFFAWVGGGKVGFLAVIGSKLILFECVWYGWCAWSRWNQLKSGDDKSYLVR